MALRTEERRLIGAIVALPNNTAILGGLRLRNRVVILGIVIACCCLALFPLNRRGVIRNASAATASESKIAAVIQAITDEIYYYDFEKETLQTDMESEIPIYIYINSKVKACTAIYRLYPYGEVYRRFFFLPNGLAILRGDAGRGFPILMNQGGSGLTATMREEEITRLKRESVKRGYILRNDFDKTPLLLRQARRLEYLHKEELGLERPEPEIGC